jgi:hypothetical protein
MRWLALLVPLLTGCGTGYVAREEPPAPPACEREANDDPAVRPIMMKMAGSGWWRANHQDELVVARREALLRCMRLKGLLPPGGVEARKPVWYGPLF